MNTISLNTVKELKTLINNRPEVPAKVPLHELFSDKFMSKYTEFTSIERLSQLGGLNVGPKGSLVIKNKKQFNQLIQDRTVFGNWSQMVMRAGREYLGFRN